MPRRFMRKERGFTILELVVSMGLMGILMLIAVMNLKEFDDPLQNASFQVVSYMKQVRGKAISNTFAYVVYPQSSTRLGARYAATCSTASGSFVDDPLMVLNLPTGASFLTTSWSLCYSSRGLSNTNLTIYLTDQNGLRKNVEVLLGGAARVL